MPKTAVLPLTVTLPSLIILSHSRLDAKMFAAIGKEVVLLKRVKIGEITLRGLDRGAYRKLTQREIAYLNSL